MTESKRVVLVGECMVELQGEPFTSMRQSCGGDTYNTAVYLRRCMAADQAHVRYATALGDDSLSAALRQRWREEGLDLGLVRTLPGKLPGLYLIELDPSGERSFHFWRESSAARHYFDTEQTPLEANSADIDVLYLSGISLAILSPAARQRVFALMGALRERGATVVFDNNYRPRLWPDQQDARTAFSTAFDLATVAMVTADDHQALFGLDSAQSALDSAKALAASEIVIKRGANSTLVRSVGRSDWLEVPVAPVARVVDTTAAGDSFAAGYLSRRLLGRDAAEAAAFGNRLAGRVIQHQGAVIDAALMRDFMSDTP